MEETLEFLKKDRKVNQTFMDRLEKVGLEVQYGTYLYWSGQEYVQIGRQRVWLVKTVYFDNGDFSVGYRYQNDVIEEIMEVFREEKEKAEKSDDMVNIFFEKLSR